MFNTRLVLLAEIVVTIVNRKGGQKLTKVIKKGIIFAGFGGQGGATDTSSRDSGLSLDGGNTVDQVSDGVKSMGLGGKENLTSPQSYGNQGK